MNLTMLALIFRSLSLPNDAFQINMCFRFLICWSEFSVFGLMWHTHHSRADIHVFNKMISFTNSHDSRRRTINNSSETISYANVMLKRPMNGRNIIIIFFLLIVKMIAWSG